MNGIVRFLMVAMGICAIATIAAVTLAGRIDRSGTPMQAVAANAPAPQLPRRSIMPEPGAGSQDLSGTLRVPRIDRHFYVTGSVDNTELRFLVDTGATLVALSWESGVELGLTRPGDTMNATFKTANGVVRGKIVTIPRLTIEDLSVDNVKAAIMPPGALEGNLLGMSFLEKLSSYRIEGDTMTMTH